MSREINMYKMMGYCPLWTFIKNAPMARESLTFAHNQKVQDLQSGLIRFIYQDLFGQTPEYKDGFVLHSGTEANELALFLAKQKVNNQRRLVLTTNLCHSSIQNACKKLELEMLILDIDPATLQVNPQKLVSVIEERGDEILLVNITYGSTQLGISEDVILNTKVQEVINRHGIWLHIDAAYGGYVLNLKEPIKAEWRKVCGMADSITIDPHKFAGTWGCGVLLLKDSSHKNLIGSETHYYTGIGTALGTTRSAFPAATAMSLIKDLGKEGLKKLSDDCYEKAQFISRALIKAGIELIAPLQTPNVPIKVNSETVARKIEQELLAQRMPVSRLKITSQKYEINGLRVCITPRPDVSWKNIRIFTEKFISIYKQAHQL